MDKDNTTAFFEQNTLEKRVYTVEEVIKILEVSKTTAYQLVKSDEFRTVRVGGKIRISKRSFDRWLDGNLGGDEECQL